MRSRFRFVDRFHRTVLFISFFFLNNNFHGRTAQCTGPDDGMDGKCKSDEKKKQVEEK